MICNCTPQGPDEQCPQGGYLFGKVAGNFRIISSPDFLTLLQKAKDATHESYQYWIEQYQQHVQRSKNNKKQQEQVRRRQTRHHR